MELEMKKGFKQTEFGTIPNDWKEVNLGKSSVLKARIGWQGLTTAEYLKTGDYFLITGTDFKNGYIDWDNCVYVERIRYDQDKNIQIKVEDVLVTKDGTIGKVAYVDKLPMKTTLNSGVFVIRPINNFYNTRYFYFVLRSRHFKEFLGKLTAGSTISHLYQKDFVHYSFPLPPTLAEQKAIAAALSDVDDLMRRLDALIAKKKAIKQGAMQQLLTGKTRLSGFGKTKDYKQSEVGLIPEDWKLYQVNDLIDLLTDYDANGSFASVAENVNVYNNDNYAWYVRSTDLEKKSKLSNVKYVDKESYKFLKKTALYGGELLFLKRGDIGNVYLFQMQTKHATVAPNLYLLKLNKLSNSTYLFNYFKSNSGQLQLKSKNASSTLGALYKDDVKSIYVPLPPTLEEQNAIANALEDMDEELDVLAAKKEKYEHIKQGMMQELLTGKTRLV